MSARQLLILDLYEMFLVRPMHTLAHPTPLSLTTNMPQAQTHTQTVKLLVQPPLRSLVPIHVVVPHLPLPPCCLCVVGRDGVRSSAQPHSMVGAECAGETGDRGHAWDSWVGDGWK